MPWHISVPPSLEMHKKACRNRTVFIILSHFMLRCAVKLFKTILCASSSKRLRTTAQGHTDSKHCLNLTKRAKHIFQCLNEEFGCADGTCVPIEKRCNGVSDCEDHFDEIKWANLKILQNLTWWQSFKAFRYINLKICRR